MKRIVKIQFNKTNNLINIPKAMMEETGFDKETEPHPDLGTCPRSHMVILNVKMETRIQFILSPGSCNEGILLY